MKILALSTDEELNRLRQFALHYAGHKADIVNTEKEAIAAVESSEEYDVILLCHKLPSSAGATDRAPAAPEVVTGKTDLHLAPIWRMA